MRREKLDNNNSYMRAGQNEEYAQNPELVKIKAMGRTTITLSIVTLVFGMAAFGAVFVQNLSLKNSMENDLKDMSNEMKAMSEDIYDIRKDVGDISEDLCTGNPGSSGWYDPYMTTEEKPVIYLYPEENEEVEVKLTTTIRDTNLIMTWPEPVKIGDTYTWQVSAEPDGTIRDAAGNEYSYLFWEADKYGEADFSKGWCVKGEDTAEFLRETLAEIGLTPEEYNEFIVYWTPRMQGNAYNIISFQGSSYDEMFPLDIVTADGDTPDSMLRVMMAWKGVDEPVEMEPQEFETFDRKGFSVVEWGGTEIR